MQVVFNFFLAATMFSRGLFDSHDRTYTTLWMVAALGYFAASVAILIQVTREKKQRTIATAGADPAN